MFCYVVEVCDTVETPIKCTSWYFFTQKISKLIILFIIIATLISVFFSALFALKTFVFSLLDLFKSLFSPSSMPAPRRRAGAEEKGAGGLFQDERVRWIGEPEFSQQALQVCVLPGLFQHIGGDGARCLTTSPHSPPHMSADGRSAVCLCCLWSFMFLPSFSSFILMGIFAWTAFCLLKRRWL